MCVCVCVCGVCVLCVRARVNAFVFVCAHVCVWIFKTERKKTHFEKVFTHVDSHASALSLLESGE